MDHLVTIQRIFREIFDDDTLQIRATTRQEDVEGWDSVAQVRLVLTIEEAFHIRFLTDEVAAIKSVGDLLSLIDRHAVK